jgi:hypothetical protein
VVNDEPAAMEEVVLPGSVAWKPPRTLLGRLLIGATSAAHVAAWASVPALAGVALLLGPGRLFSREMTWDLLYNLEGAWHLHNGQVPHVDFHTPLGAMTFELTRIGFAMVGTIPLAALAGPLLLVVPALAAGAVAAARRLPLLPAVLFTVYVTLLVMMPANVGDLPNAYSLAMAYNRWGWSALTILCLLLFVPPRSGVGRPWIDPFLGGALLLFAFYLKITYAVASVAAIVAAIVVMSHVRRQWRPWIAALGAVLLNAALPHSRAYLADVWAAASTGYTRASIADQVLSTVSHRAEFAIYAVVVMFVVWLWRRGRAPAESIFGSLLVLGVGMFVLSQNSQAGDIPVALVPFFLICRTLWRAWPRTSKLLSWDAVPVMVAVLVWPMLAVAAEATTLAAYYRAASRDQRVDEITTTNLRGLAVPADRRDLEETLADGPFRVQSLLRDPPLRDPLSQQQYLGTLLEAAALLGSEKPPAVVFVLDQVNAMPFVLGHPPPRGSNLWLWEEEPPRPAAELFADVDVVLVPKYSTLARSTVFALNVYGDYLATAFPVRHDTRSWSILRRASPSQRE